MKKWMICVICILGMCLIMSGMVSAQDKKQTTQTKKEVKKFKVDDKFLTTWKKVGTMTKEVRSFKTEKSTTVAGVRAAEAEDEALKYLYFKGGTKYPSRLELKNAVELLSNFLRENPNDEGAPESQYFIGQCQVQLGEIDKGIQAYNKVLENYPESEYAEIAKEEIERLKKSK
ncbi:MAG: tetratricopeptide repeat protein [bacterium]|nr:tetratricopeptide repeat protein [bacterium]